MKKAVKYLLFALSLALFLCITALVLIQARERRHLMTCKSVEISFKDTLNFVSEDDVRTYLKRDCPVLIGQRVDSIRLYEIEKALDSRSAILSAQAWTSDSVLHISIRQREPVARMETADHAFYIDDRGFIFPVQGDCGKTFPLVQGRLPLHEPVGYKGLSSTEEGQEWVEKMLTLIAYMKKSKWDGRIAKMTVLADGDIVMTPVEGRENYIFGRPENVQEKFARMNEYCKRIKPAVEDDYYASVNVKYKGQIICRK
ncbi:MAG: hypothetical protein J6X57_06470 [Bacteroidales bacterium]|nr:hypothetical protein [Bacteroidales bacterium]